MLNTNITHIFRRYFVPFISEWSWNNATALHVFILNRLCQANCCVLCVMCKRFTVVVCAVFFCCCCYALCCCCCWCCFFIRLFSVCGSLFLIQFWFNSLISISIGLVFFFSWIFGPEHESGRPISEIELVIGVGRGRSKTSRCLSMRLIEMHLGIEHDWCIVVVIAFIIIPFDCVHQVQWESSVISREEEERKTRVITFGWYGCITDDDG